MISTKMIFRSNARRYYFSFLQKAAFGQPAFQTHPHLVQMGEVTPGITKTEYKHRRSRLMQLIQSSPLGSKYRNHIVIVPSTTKQFMTNDIPYTFRQNTDFLYLSGFMEPNSVLILEKNEEDPEGNSKSSLFVPNVDKKSELWDGKSSGINGSLELTGVDRAFTTDMLGNYLSSYLSQHPKSIVWYEYLKPPHQEFHRRYISDFLSDNKHGTVENVKSWIQALRVIKSPAEIDLMKKSCDIAAKAFKEVMRFSQSNINESHLQAKMDFECRMAGAEYLAYPPVIAGGNRANTIHYINNNQLIQEDEMVLMDAGCEYHGYTSDITRTWPISGEFSRAQLEVYEAVLEVQEECIALCKEDITIDNIYYEMLRLLGNQLKRLHIIRGDLEGTDLQRAVREFCPHHVGHYLGMDVHDTNLVSRSVRLQPGMVVTIEPGLYLPEHNRSIPAEFRGIGVRIEDDILVQENSYINLTEHAPKRPHDVKSIFKTVM